MSRCGWAVRRDARREVGSGSGRAMRRCSFAGPPPIVVDVLGVGCFMVVLGISWEAWTVTVYEVTDRCMCFSESREDNSQC